MSTLRPQAIVTYTLPLYYDPFVHSSTSATNPAVTRLSPSSEIPAEGLSLFVVRFRGGNVRGT
jgi:hypothetical protein